MKISSEAVTPSRSVNTGFEGKNPHKVSAEQEVAPKKAPKVSDSVFPTYGADGKIDNPEKIGGLVNSNL